MGRDEKGCSVHARFLFGVVLPIVVGGIVASGCGSAADMSAPQDKPSTGHLYYNDGGSVWSISLVGDPNKRRVFDIDDMLGGFAITADYVFWASGGCQPEAEPCNGLFRADRDGSHSVQLVGELWFPENPVIVGDHVYWIDDTGIGRARIDGSEVERSFVEPLAEDLEEPATALASDGTYLYFARCAGAAIGRVKLDGTELDREFISDGGGFCPDGLASIDGRLYWSDLLINGRTLVGRASTDGGQVEPSWLDGGPLGDFNFAAGSGALFWTWGHGGKSPWSYVGRASLDGQNLDLRFFRIPSGSLIALGP